MSEQVKAPAIALLVFGGIALVGAIGVLVMNVLGIGLGAMGAMGDESQGLATMLQGGIGSAMGIVGIIFNLVVLVGALKMMKLQSYGLAMAAAILAMIPCGLWCCCFIGLPIGIWALVVLMKPEVKAAFQG